MKTFKEYVEVEFALPEYPVQTDPDKDDGEWITGDPPKPIEGFEKSDAKSIVDKANKQVIKDREK
jgi:hypothetical protein